MLNKSYNNTYITQVDKARLKQRKCPETMAVRQCTMARNHSNSSPWTLGVTMVTVDLEP